MRLLGIDPGLQTTGFGVIDAEGGRLSYVASGTIRTSRVAQGDLPARIKVLFEGVQEVIDRYQPEQAALEIVFVNVNPQATLKLGQARGACLSALVHRNLTVAEYTALQMKQAVAGHGRAAKAQVQEMVAPIARRAWTRCGRCLGPGHHPCPQRLGLVALGCRRGLDPQSQWHVPPRAQPLTT
jgi:crossover junction endodeoxyribonuclease RuvC